MNRGSAAARRQRRMARIAFNEAPIHESGKWQRVVTGSSQERPFNEAPIHESGKSRAYLRGGRAGRPFNEAPIHESGKSETQATQSGTKVTLQ